MVPNEIVICNEANYRSFYCDEYIMCDILIYSHATSRLEIMKSCVSPEDGECVVSINEFRDYIHRFGKYSCNLYWESIRRTDYDVDYDYIYNLNDESKLKLYGYSVGTNSKLSRNDRWELLTELIDLDIMNGVEIISLLRFFVGSHKGIKYEYARGQWEEDINFVDAYSANPNRFLVIKNGVCDRAIKR